MYYAFCNNWQILKKSITFRKRETFYKMEIIHLYVVEKCYWINYWSRHFRFTKETKSINFQGNNNLVNSIIIILLTNITIVFHLLRVLGKHRQPAKNWLL